MPITRRLQPEAHLLLRCIKRLRMSGWDCGKVKTKGSFYKGRYILDVYQMKGLPDAFAFRKGVALAVETKIGKNVQSDDQKKFQQLWDNGDDRRYIIVRQDEDIDVWL